MKATVDQNKTPDICIFLPDLVGGGAQRVLLNLANGIAERGHSVDLVLVKRDGAYLNQVSSDVNLVDLRCARARQSLPRLVQYLRKHRPPVLLTGIHTNAIALWAKKAALVQTRIFISLHGTASAASVHQHGEIGEAKRSMQRKFYSWADGIIAVSKGVAEDSATVLGVPPTAIRTIYNPVITPELRRMSGEKVVLPWGDADDLPVVLAAGRLSPEKDYASLIKALAIVHNRCRSRLLILGEGSERASLEQLVHDLGMDDYVTLPGFVENPYSYMTDADLYVLSSVREGLPTALIEALYCGLPVVSTDCPSGPREILEDGRYGLLVPTGDVDALASAMLKGLQGNIPIAEGKSWRRYELQSVIDEYLAYMFEQKPAINLMEQVN